MNKVYLKRMLSYVAYEDYSILTVIRFFVKGAFFKTKNRLDKDENLIFFIGDTSRSDYLDIWSHVIGNKKKLILKFELKIGFNLDFILSLIKNRDSFSEIQSIFPSLSSFNILNIYLRYCFLSENAKAILNGKEVRNITFLSDAFPLEVSIISFLDKEKTTIISLQHAFFDEYKHKNTIDENNYKGLISDCILCWCNDSARVINKYNEIQCMVAGVPKSLISDSDENRKRVLIIVDYNMKIDSLNINIPNGYQYYFLFHPKDIRGRGDGGYPILKERVFLRSDIIYGYKSSLVKELIASGISVRVFSNVHLSEYNEIKGESKKVTNLYDDFFNKKLL
ncbi:hypothetical protein AB6E02_16090 [Vibrio cyclitrophicus]